MTLLFSNPTIDYIYKTEEKPPIIRIGGPGYYSSIYTSTLNDRLVLVGKANYIDKPFIEKHFAKTDNIYLHIIPGECTQKYLLLYLSTKKRIALPINKCPLPEYRELLHMKKYLSPENTIIWNPTIITEKSDIDSLLYLRKWGKTLSLDLQGITREERHLSDLLAIIKNLSPKIIHSELNEINKITQITNTSITKLIKLLSTESIILSNGGGSLLFYYKKKKKRVTPPFNANVIDTTGAGDVLLYSYTVFLEKENEIDAIRKAVATASLHVLKVNRKLSSITIDLIEEYAGKVRVY